MSLYHLGLATFDSTEKHLIIVLPSVKIYTFIKIQFSCFLLPSIHSYPLNISTLFLTLPDKLLHERTIFVIFQVVQYGVHGHYHAHYDSTSENDPTIPCCRDIKYSTKCSLCRLDMRSNVQ